MSELNVEEIPGVPTVPDMQAKKQKALEEVYVIAGVAHLPEGHPLKLMFELAFGRGFNCALTVCLEATKAVKQFKETRSEFPDMIDE